MTQKERRLYLIRKMLAEQPRYQYMEVPQNETEQKQLLRGLFNIRMPRVSDSEFLQIQDEYLQAEIAEKGIIDYKSLTPVEDGVFLWRGDITTLRCGAIVNAANSGMLGCFHPNHGCIDNAIHTFAGVQLRAACAEIMEQQGHEEKTGTAKITPAFNLPCDYILHTVGPIVYDRLTPEHEDLLASCYHSCMELAEQNGVKSVAFCCISTGEFRFPNDKAAEIAIKTVQKYRALTNGKIEVIFNVFKELDEKIYRKLLHTN